MFPGHGTPTCIVLGKPDPPSAQHAIRITGILPGGGDLRTPPEESPLWHTIAANHDKPEYQDVRICVADRPLIEMTKWPWNLDVGAVPLKQKIDINCDTSLNLYLGEDVGFDIIFGATELYHLTSQQLRRLELVSTDLIQLVVGDASRDWQINELLHAIYPYTSNCSPSLSPSIENYLSLWKQLLSERPQLGGKSQVEAGFEWFEYYRFTKKGQHRALTFPEIATHFHAVDTLGPMVFTQKSPLIVLVPELKG